MQGRAVTVIQGHRAVTGGQWPKGGVADGLSTYPCGVADWGPGIEDLMLGDQVGQSQVCEAKRTSASCADLRGSS